MGHAIGKFKNFEEAESFVDQLIKENHVLVFSKTHCRFCLWVKKVWDIKGANALVVEIDKFHAGDTRLLQEVLEKRTNQKSVPFIFIGKEHEGGFNALTYLVDDILEPAPKVVAPSPETDTGCRVA